MGDLNVQTAHEIILRRMLLKRGMGNGEWGMGNGKLKMGNEKLKMGNLQRSAPE